MGRKSYCGMTCASIGCEPITRGDRRAQSCRAMKGLRSEKSVTGKAAAGVEIAKGAPRR